MLIRLTIVGIPCLKTNAAAGYYQWVRDKRKKIYSSKSQKQLGENIWLHSLINQAQLITPLRSFVFVFLSLFTFVLVCLLFVPSISGKSGLKTGCVFKWPCLESQVHIKRSRCMLERSENSVDFLLRSL